MFKFKKLVKLKKIGNSYLKNKINNIIILIFKNFKR